MTPLFSRALFLTLLPAILVVGPAPEAAEAARGRPRVEDRTLVADNGRLLRGSRWALDNAGSIPPLSLYDTLKNTGMNALHVYAESFAEARCRGLTAGHRAKLLDQMIDTAATKGIYVVITIGNGSSLHGLGDPNCNSANGQYDAAYATAFWNLYAGRYKDRTHVIYEIQNEPYLAGGKSHPSPASLRGFEQDMYDLIRSKAPQAPILFYSYAVFNVGSEIVADLDALSGVDWSKAAVAFHGYGGLSGTQSARSYVASRGFPVVQTEFFVFPNGVQQPDIAQTDLYERTRTSWFTFVDMPLLGNPANFRTPIDQASLLWAADYGTWPAVSSPPFGTSPTLRTPGILWQWVTAPSSSSPLVLEEPAPLLSATYEPIRQPGTFWVALKSLNTGRFVSAVNGSQPLIANRTAVSRWEQFDWLKNPNGGIFLKCRANNRFVRVSTAATTKGNLIANSTRAVAAARFSTLPPPKPALVSSPAGFRFLDSSLRARRLTMAGRADIQQQARRHPSRRTE